MPNIPSIYAEKAARLLAGSSSQRLGSGQKETYLSSAQAAQRAQIRSL